MAFASFVQEYLVALSARSDVSSKKSSFSSRVEPQLKQLKVHYADLEMLAVKISNIDERKRLANLFSEMVPISEINKVLAAIDDFKLWFDGLPRSQRRKIEKDSLELIKVGVEINDIAEKHLEYLDSLDPTPEDYLLDEARKAHGEHSGNIFASFDEVVSSNKSTLATFKQRHNLK